MDRAVDRICRLCTREVSVAAAVHLYSPDSQERGVADRMAEVLNMPLGEEDGLSPYVCELCNARFNFLVRSLEVHRLNAKKSYEKLAKKAGIYIEPLNEESPAKLVEDAHNPTKDPLVQAADMTSADLGSLLSDLVAAKKRMKEKNKETGTDRKVATEDIKDLMNLLSGIREADVFVFGTFLGVPDARMKDIEMNYSHNHQRYLTEVVMAWINMCPESSTWSTLVEALTEVGHRKVAHEVAERRGIVPPGVFDDGQLWKALKVLIPINEGGDIVTLMENTEKLRMDVKTKDALLFQNEQRLDEVNSEKAQLETKYNDTLQELEEQKQMLDDEKQKAAKSLRMLEADLKKLRADRASKEKIESKEIEIMRLKNKLQQCQNKEKKLVAEIVDLQQKLEANDVGKLEWIAKNLEKQLEGVRPEFERERSQMMNNIYKMLKYIKVPEDLPDEEEEDSHDSDPPEPVAAETDDTENVEEEELAGDAEAGEDTEQQETQEQPKTPEPEPTDLESLLSTLQSPTEDSSAISMFEDKAFVLEDHPLAVRLFQETPPFLLSQLLGLTMDQWLAIERRHTRDQEKQRGGVLSTWSQRGDSAKWSVLVEALIVMGLRGKAQIACIEKGVPLPDVSEASALWSSVKATLMTGNEAVQQMFMETESVLEDVKKNDEYMCARETELEQSRAQAEVLRASLKRNKHELTREMSQCTALERRMAQQTSHESDELFPEDDPALEGEISELRGQHKSHMEAVQCLWREKEERKREFGGLVERAEPLEEGVGQMRAEFGHKRARLVTRLEEMYDLFTGREKPVPKDGLSFFLISLTLIILCTIAKHC